MSRKRFHVVHESGHWHVESAGSRLVSTDTKLRAIELARDTARREQPSQILVHGEDGKIQEEFTYQHDPHPRFGS